MATHTNHITVAMPAKPFVSSTPLQFRGIDDSLARHHLEGSECCLIHADNPLTRDLGVYVNPRVRVGYDSAAYKKANPEGGSVWISTWSVLWGVWTNRVTEWTLWAWEDSLVKRKVRKRLARWKKEDPSHHEPGDFCLINEMQVIVWNGWAHV